MFKTSLAALAFIGLLSPVSADTYPSRTVHIVVASAPGGGTDTTARILAARLSQAMGQQFIIDNKPGAGNVLGSDYVARATPDGYTLLMAASAITTHHVVYKNLPYDLRRDFMPISEVVASPNTLVVGASQPYTSAQEFIAAARAHPGELTYASAGVGTAPHMAMELLKSVAKIDVTHVPYTGVAPALTDVIGGRVTSMLVNYLSAKPQLAAGALRGLAMSTLQRSVFAPDLPTLAESGAPAYEATQWFGLLAPKGTPADIIEKLSAETAKALQAPDMKQMLVSEGAEPIGNSPAAFAKLINSEMDKWSLVGKQAHLQPE